MVDQRRIRVLKAGADRRGPVIYWMSRDQRAHNNWGLLYAQDLAILRQSPLAVAFCLVPRFLNATLRQYAFMLKGLAGVSQTLAGRAIPFHLLTGEPETEVPWLAKKLKAGALVTDFDPLRVKRAWKEGVARGPDIPFYEVDAHNIVPCWLASSKQEWPAYPFRPKIHRALPEFLTEFPEHPFLTPPSTVRNSPADCLTNAPAYLDTNGSPRL